jgi:hypothetical protein
MRGQTLLKAWAAFGVFWFITFSLLTFLPQAFAPLAVIAAMSLYVGMILAAVSIVLLTYESLRLLLRKPKKKVRKSE